MYNNKWFPLIVFICMGFFTTSCSKYSSRSTMGGSGDHGIGACPLASDCDLDDAYGWEDESGGINQFDWSTVDLSKIDLCKVYDQQTLLCQTIETGEPDLLKKFLEHIKSDPKKYRVRSEQWFLGDNTLQLFERI